MLKVDHKITIDQDIWSSTDHSRLIDLRMAASMDIPVNQCRIEMTYPIGLSLAPEQEVQVELGYDEDLSLVFTGTIEAVDWQLEKVSIRAASTVRKLAASAYNLYFDRPKAGDIVSALCSETDVKTGAIDPGVVYDFYAVGSQISAFEHIRQLADDSGFDLYTDPNDQLVFAMPIPGNTVLFQFGINILSLQLEEPQEQLTGLQVYGESPSSLGQGPDAASWLTKKEVKGEAGDQSGMIKQFNNPAAKSLQNASMIAQSRYLKEKDKTKGVLRTLGDASLQLGDLAMVQLMPIKQQNGLYKITGITHKINPKKGFVTTLNLESI